MLLKCNDWVPLPSDLYCWILDGLFLFRDAQQMKHHLCVCVFLGVYVLVGLSYMSQCFCPQQSYVITVSPFLLLMEYSVLYDRATNRVSIPAHSLCHYDVSTIKISENNSIYRITAIAKAKNLSRFGCFIWYRSSSNQSRVPGEWYI